MYYSTSLEKFRIQFAFLLYLLKLVLIIKKKFKVVSVRIFTFDVFLLSLKVIYTTKGFSVLFFDLEYFLNILCGKFFQVNLESLCQIVCLYCTCF